MFWFNVERLITGLHHKSVNYCVACVKVVFYFCFLFHLLIPVIFERLPFLVFRKVCVDDREEMKRLGEDSEPACLRSGLRSM